MNAKKSKGTAQRSFYNAVKRSSHATGATWDVLCAMIWLAEFNKNEVTATKAAICLEARCCWYTTLRAISWLEAEGTIEKTKNPLGGRGKATSWKFHVAQEAPNLLHLIPEERQTEAVRDLFAVGEQRVERVQSGILGKLTEQVPALVSWFQDVELVALVDGKLILKTGNSFVAKRLQNEELSMILRAANDAGLTISEVEVAVKAA